MRYLRGGGLPPAWALVSVSVIHDGQAPACHLYQVHDLSDQKAAAETLAALAEERLRREASELANASKGEFLNRVSHQMRTPPNAVMGFAQLLKLQKAGSNRETLDQYAGHIHAAGQHLLGQVTDLLDLNRAAEVALQIEATLTVMAEPQRLRQVLVKLLSNAIKYKRRGGTVQLGVSALNASTARLVVQDNRIGMTTEQQQRLFQPFERLGVERTSTPGTGLGLVIARSLINEMGGQLALTSAPGVGTTVTLTLPLAPAS